ncbi:MAG TPA: pyridoxamine 5'-phosphate oxidase family protein [Acidimicrobiia bacterium]|nr:pyridoxamine 5'-phosphate oxidase family protein [Acidimicrobiia bacterium]
MPPRPRAQRKADALEKLAHDEDAWVATASPAGVAHLVPLSFVWDGERVVIATEATSVTARNVVASGRARLGLGPTRDVVVVDTEVEVVGATEVGDAHAQLFAERLGWDPRPYGGGWVYLLMRPVRVLAWREADELEGRVVMRDGTWVE